MTPRKRIGEMLMEAGIIDETQLKAALAHQRQWGCASARRSSTSRW